MDKKKSKKNRFKERLGKNKIKISKKAGLPPGSLVFIGQERSENKFLELISFDTGGVETIRSEDPKEIFARLQDSKVSWLNLEGLNNIASIEQIGEKFGLNDLVLEDILNTQRRPSMENYDGYLAITLKTLHSIDEHQIQFEQVSFILGKNYVLSFQERPGDIFDTVRERLKQPKNRLSTQGSDYLFYRLLDTVVDSYYIVLEEIGERIEELEETIITHSEESTFRDIQHLRKELIFLRKSIYPLREAISKIIKERTDLFKEETYIFLTDVYDHAIHVIDTLETYRDLVSSLTETYMNSVSQRMNEVMKVLTIIATIFIPLTFVAGIYGMNFNNMPELQWKWGYFATLGVMALVTILMIFYFKRKRWL